MSIAFLIASVASLILAVVISRHDIKTLRIPNKFILYQLLIGLFLLVAEFEFSTLLIWILVWLAAFGVSFFFGTLVEQFYMGWGDIKSVLALLPLFYILGETLLFIMLVSLFQIGKAVLIHKPSAFAPFISCAGCLTYVNTIFK